MSDDGRRPRVGPDAGVRGRTAVVTGAGSGIGAATVLRLCAGGARVALLGRRAERLTEVAARTGRAEDVLTVPTDVSDALALADAMDTVHQRFGTVDMVVAAAGVLTGAPFEDGVPGEWAEMVDTNLVGLMGTAQTFSRDLLDAASSGASDLFLVGALAGQERFPGYAVYSAVEAAVDQLAHALRAEHGPRGVRVHQVAPGLTDTELGTGMSHAGASAHWESYRGQVVGMDPDEVARAVVFAAGLPSRVNLAEVLVLPTRQDADLPHRERLVRRADERASGTAAPAATTPRGSA